MLELLQRQGYHPRYVVWELTLACDMTCKHCGSLAGRPRPDELSHAEGLELVDALIALGCWRLSLSGGEPTLHPRWDLLGRRLVEGGVRTNLITNGWRFGDDDLERARDAGLENVVFSLDGLEAHHDAVRRAGSFQRVVAAVERCAAAGMPVAVCTHVNRLNLHALEALRARLTELGVAMWQVQLGVPTGGMGQNQELVIAPQDLLELIPALAQLAEAPGGPTLRVAENLGYFGRFERLLRGPTARLPFFTGCRAGCQVLGIESNGDLKGCLSLPSHGTSGRRFVEGSLRAAPLAALWRDPKAFALNRGFASEQLGGFCAVCRYGDICRGGCSWTAYSHTGACHDNPYCFYRQAVLCGRTELLDEAPTEPELRFAARR